MLGEAWRRFRDNAGTLYGGLGITVGLFMGVGIVLVVLAAAVPFLAALAMLPVILVLAPLAQSANAVLAVDSVRGTASLRQFWEAGWRYQPTFLGLMALQLGITMPVSAVAVYSGWPNYISTLWGSLFGACVMVAAMDVILTGSPFWRAVGKGLLIWRQPLVAFGLLIVLSGPQLFAGVSGMVHPALGILLGILAAAYTPLGMVIIAVWCLTRLEESTAG